MGAQPDDRPLFRSTVIVHEVHGSGLMVVWGAPSVAAAKHQVRISAAAPASKNTDDGEEHRHLASLVGRLRDCDCQVWTNETYGKRQLTNHHPLVVEAAMRLGWSHPDSPIQDRFIEFDHQALSEKADRINRGIDPAKLELRFAQASNARSTSSKITWLREAAEHVGVAVRSANAAPCRRGCSACCHIPVTVSQGEADLIAARSRRRRPSRPAESITIPDDESFETLSVKKDQHEVATRRHIGTPCPFLVSGSCSIYDDRPLVCRYHFMLDDDNVLCQLVPGDDVNAPYLNAMQYLQVSTMIQVPTVLADIRDWFK